MEKIQITNIKIGERRREDLGDIAALAESINRYGLLAPIILTDDGTLVAGQRRLEAMKQLGWTETPYISKGQLTQTQLHEIELEENIRRKDFTEYEISKNMVALAEAIGKRLVEENEFRPKLGRNSSRGRPEKPDGLSAIANEVGVPRSTIYDARAHVAAVEEYPVLEAVPKTKAIGIAKLADKLPEERREAFTTEQVAMLQHGVKPVNSVADASNVIRSSKNMIESTSNSEEEADHTCVPLPDNVIPFPKDRIVYDPRNDELDDELDDAPVGYEPLPDNVIPFPRKYGASNQERGETGASRTAAQRAELQAAAEADSRAYKLTKSYNSAIYSIVQLSASPEAVREWVGFSEMDSEELKGALSDVHIALDKLGRIERILTDCLRRM